MKHNIKAFTGMVPKLAPHLIPDSAAQVAANVRLMSGALTSINTPSLESSNIITNAISVYMIGAPGASVPLSWTTDVDVAASPVADTEYRIYYTGDGVPKKTSASLAGTPTGGPTTWYNLGVPTPTSAPTLSSVGAGGSVPVGTYSYVYTYVTQFGTSLLEESAPSPALTGVTTTAGNQTVNLTGLANPPSLTNYNYVYKRIYRTTGSTYQMVAQISSATTTYTDTLSATGIPGDSLTPTAYWAPPPSDLKGIHALPSSVLVGFRNNEVWFSEPGYPHAWPSIYMQSFDTQIVGLKVFGNNVVIGTQSYPFIGSGVHPDSFTFQKLPMLEPCLAKRSMAGDESGVIYASSNGLIGIGAESGTITQSSLTRDTFSSYSPETFTSCVFERRYYGFYNSVAAGTGALVYSKDDPAPISTVGFTAKAVFVDASTARMLFVDDLNSKLYRFDPPTTVPYTYTWKSKVFRHSYPLNLGCFRVVAPEQDSAAAAYAAAVAAANVAIAAANAAAYAAAGGIKSDLNAMELNASTVYGVNGSTLQALIPAVADTVGVTVWGAKTVLVNGTYEVNKIHRLPSGTLSYGYEIQVTGQRTVWGLQMATSPQELNDGD